MTSSNVTAATPFQLLSIVSDAPLSVNPRAIKSAARGYALAPPTDSLAFHNQYRIPKAGGTPKRREAFRVVVSDHNSY
jgi:hypothetical protein